MQNRFMLLPEMLQFLGHDMIALPQDRMDQLLKRFSMIESQMANNPDSDTYVKLASNIPNSRTWWAKSAN